MWGRGRRAGSRGVKEVKTLEDLIFCSVTSQVIELKHRGQGHRYLTPASTTDTTVTRPFCCLVPIRRRKRVAQRRNGVTFPGQRRRQAGQRAKRAFGGVPTLGRADQTRVCRRLVTQAVGGGAWGNLPNLAPQGRCRDHPPIRK